MRGSFCKVGVYIGAIENGDTNEDGRIDVGDVVYFLRYLEYGGPDPSVCGDKLEYVAQIDSAVVLVSDAIEEGSMVMVGGQAVIGGIQFVIEGIVDDVQAPVIGQDIRIDWGVRGEYSVILIYSEIGQSLDLTESPIILRILGFGKLIDAVFSDVNGQSRTPSMGGDNVSVTIKGVTIVGQEDGVVVSWCISEREDRIRLERSRSDGCSEPPTLLGRGSGRLQNGWYCDSLIDRAAEQGKEYIYQIVAEYENRDSVLWSQVFLYNPDLPRNLVIDRVYPNPFNAEAILRFGVPMEQKIKVAVFDLDGRHVSTIYNGNIKAGYHTIRWDGRNAAGQPAASGVYVFRIEAESGIRAQKATVVK